MEPATWNLTDAAPACSSCVITLSYTAGVKPVGRKYIPNAIDILLTKMNRHDFSKDDIAVAPCNTERGSNAA